MPLAYVAEDDEKFRTGVVNALEKAGYDVVAFPTTDALLRHCGFIEGSHDVSNEELLDALFLRPHWATPIWEEKRYITNGNGKPETFPDLIVTDQMTSTLTDLHPARGSDVLRLFKGKGVGLILTTSEKLHDVTDAQLGAVETLKQVRAVGGASADFVAKGWFVTHPEAALEKARQAMETAKAESNLPTTEIHSIQKDGRGENRGPGSGRA